MEILTDDGSPEVSIHPNEDGTSYTCSFVPRSLTRHIISIDYAGLVPDKNPFFCQVIQEKDIQLAGPAMTNQCLALNEPTHFFFKLTDVLSKQTLPENTSTYESGYSSNDDTSLSQSTSEQVKTKPQLPPNYRVTITDGQGHVKSNVLVQEIDEKAHDHVRVDFTPDEKILYVNISCTW